MSGALRVLVVTRRFWPNCSDSTQRLMNWVQVLHNGGASVSCCPRGGIQVGRIESIFARCLSIDWNCSNESYACRSLLARASRLGCKARFEI